MTFSQQPANRFPAWPETAALLKAGDPFRVRVPGSPIVEIYFSPSPLRLGFRAEDRAVDPIATSPWESIKTERVNLDGKQYLQISTHIEHLFPDFYSIGCLFADRVQLSKLAATEAWTDVLDSVSELLSQRSTLSDEQQVGLFGELLLLEALAGHLGWDDAVESWIAPLAEQHDFAWQDLDLEVKTTTTESRSHVIHGLGQMTANPNRDLFLVSIQITRTGQAGRSLPDLIRGIRAGLSAQAPGTNAKFDEGLALAGWKDSDVDLLVRKYSLRTAPAVIPSSQVPAVTSVTLLLKATDRSRLSDVSYRVNVDGLGEVSDDLGAYIKSLSARERTNGS